MISSTLVTKRQLDNVKTFGEDSKIEWFDERKNTFVFVCARCDWGGTKPITIGFEGENFERFVLMYCPTCGLEVEPSFIS